jgi:hypothetical protein
MMRSVRGCQADYSVTGWANWRAEIATSGGEPISAITNLAGTAYCYPPPAAADAVELPSWGNEGEQALVMAAWAVSAACRPGQPVVQDQDRGFRHASGEASDH